MSNQVISFIWREKVGISQKMRVIPTFSFYSARKNEPKQFPGREKHEIGHSYRSFTGYHSDNQNRRKNANIGQLWGLVLLPISGIPYTERISGDLPLQENSQVFSLVGTRRAWTGCLLPDSGWERSWWWNARKITKSKKGLRSAEHHLPAWAPFSFSYNQIRFKTFCRTQERTVDVSYYSSNGGVLPIDGPKSWIEECNFYVIDKPIKTWI